MKVLNLYAGIGGTLFQEKNMDMQITKDELVIDFVFRIKEIGVRKWHVVPASVSVPMNWFEMNETDQMNYLSHSQGYRTNDAGLLFLDPSHLKVICQSAKIYGEISDFTYTSKANC